MAFREKSAWISLVATVGVYGAYFFYFSQAVRAGRPFGLGGAFVGTVIVLIAVQIVLHIVVAIASPMAEIHAPLDERERWIQSRASAFAFYVLQAGAVMAALSVYFIDKLVLANFVIGAVALAQGTQYLGVIVGYRRWS